MLGQEVNDEFGTAVSSDGTWLYISAPAHKALKQDVPSLANDRQGAGVVYQLRTKVRTANQPNLAQLWIEPGRGWPEVDAEIDGRTDYTMPVPHQYIIETVGSTRGNYTINTTDFVFPNLPECPKTTLTAIVNALDKAWAKTNPDIAFEVSVASDVYGYQPYPSDTAGYYVDRTPQIVGPHENAHISHVRALGDVDGDGVRDFAVGSADIKNPANPANVVGAVYIVYGRPLGLEGDYLLENLHVDPGAPNRLHGIMLKGTSAGEKLGRVVGAAGDFNGDGYDDVIVGNENGNAGTGEAILILGASNLESPANGWTVNDIVSAGFAIRFVGKDPNDLAGANVAGAGDVDGDGYSDVLIAAPGASDGKGAVYLVYGSHVLSGQIKLADVGKVDVPGAKFIGRVTGDRLGGGTKPISGAWPFTAYSCGVAALGDIDGDGKADYAISAMLADPNLRLDGGEVYILYGVGDR